MNKRIRRKVTKNLIAKVNLMNEGHDVALNRQERIVLRSTWKTISAKAKRVWGVIKDMNSNFVKTILMLSQKVKEGDNK